MTSGRPAVEPPRYLVDVESAVLGWLATVSRDGIPNVSPKEIFCRGPNGTVLIADIASPRTVANLRGNRAVCFSFIDIFCQRGWKLTGEALVVTPSDAGFSSRHTPLSELCGPRFKIRSVIELHVAGAARIVAPSYRLVPPPPQHELIDQAMRSYGVRPSGDLSVRE